MSEEIKTLCKEAIAQANLLQHKADVRKPLFAVDCGIVAMTLRNLDYTVSALSAELAKAREVMQEIEWSSFVWNNGHAFQACPCCRSKRKVFEPFGHSPGCKLNAALAAKGPTNE